MGPLISSSSYYPLVKSTAERIKSKLSISVLKPSPQHFQMLSCITCITPNVSAQHHPCSQPRPSGIPSLHGTASSLTPTPSLPAMEVNWIRTIRRLGDKVV